MPYDENGTKGDREGFGMEKDEQTERQFKFTAVPNNQERTAKISSATLKT